MTRLLLLSLLGCLAWSGCGPLVTTIYAQTLPITRTLAWDQPNEATDGIVSWVTKQDGVTIGNPTVKTQTITITTYGTHTWTVVAVNEFGLVSPAGTLTRNVAQPSTPSNLRLQ